MPIPTSDTNGLKVFSLFSPRYNQSSPQMSPPTQSSSVRQFFSRHGALSEWHPNYEYRPGQLEMAAAVDSALTDRKHRNVEAGAGTRKPEPAKAGTAPRLSFVSVLTRK